MKRPKTRSVDALRARTVEDRYHWLEAEVPDKGRPPRCLSHVLKAIKKRQWRMIHPESLK